MGDGFEDIWNGFFRQRTRHLMERFIGRYRALVVETNDPLRMHRVRFKVPELHDFDLKPEECPWAIPAPDMGNHRSGRWTHPCIGDWVWIDFEKNHPYGPVWSGFATPTRRKFYTLPSIYGKTPIPVDEKSETDKKPNDYADEYLPKDERPMSHGWVDRYGNIDIHSSVGFFPKEHDVDPPPADLDALTKADFEQAKKRPESNDPDSKFMARISKYGHILLQSDIGYIWKKDGSKGEFEGDFEKDDEWEIKRWKYLQRVLHEDKPKELDQRRMLMMTRYGHKLEMRDVGWSHTRDGEYDKQTEIGNDKPDQRWFKLRTKGGHLIECIDIGFDVKEDEFIKRLLVDEVGASTPIDKEDKFGDDARQIRLSARTGRKIVIDDRKSSKSKAHDKDLANNEIGMGILMKGRASPGSRCDYDKKSGDPKGYYWQFNELPGKNHTTWGTPLGQTIEMSDHHEAIVIASVLPDLPTKCEFLENNEFLEKSALDLNPARSTHHMILDLQREVIRLKSRAGQGQGPKCPQSGSAFAGEHAGLEVHDAPSDDPWTEIVDAEHRGIWLSTKQKLGVWRAKHGMDMYLWLDDGNQQIVIRNNQGGKVQIFCGKEVEIIGEHIHLQAAKTCTIKAPDGINFQVGGARYAFTEDALDTNVDVKMRNSYAYYPQIHDGIFPPPGAPSGHGKSVSNVLAVDVPTTEPSNRL